MPSPETLRRSFCEGPFLRLDLVVLQHDDNLVLIIDVSVSRLIAADDWDRFRLGIGRIAQDFLYLRGAHVVLNLVEIILIDPRHGPRIAAGYRHRDAKRQQDREDPVRGSEESE